MQRNHVKITIALLLSAAFAWGALPPTTVWEVRPTVGNDTTASGCFDSAKSGTDYSQQNSAQYTATDLASVSSLVISSVSHSFISTDVGNCIHITAGTGFTAGFYEIVSVSAGQATLDRSPGTVGTGGTYYVGGALATVAQANTNASQANIVWIKASGTYTVTAAMTITLNSNTSGTCGVAVCPGNPLSFIGYTSTRGDGGQITWTTSTNSVDMVDFTQAGNVLFENIIFSSTAGTPGEGLLAKTTGNTLSVYVINCKLSGFSVGIDGDFAIDWAFVGLFVENTRITAGTSHGLRNSSNTYIFGSMFDNNGGDGAQFSGNSASTTAKWSVAFSVFYKNSGNGLNLNNTNSGGTDVPTVWITNSDFSTNTGGGVVNGAGNVINPFVRIENSILDANGTYGLDAGAGTTVASWIGYNDAFYNNTTAATRNVSAGIGTITLTASPYTAIGSNFALNSTTGGGAALKNAGFPGTIPGAGAGAISVGALQPTVSSGGGQKAFAIIQ